ncbi:hypothetical protein SAMN04515667_2841 [Formosa sp. Hel1_31_208]|uniref:hypothetical protein n=1 Tax=Formosa sp. Hel1_31_208 TaxID=1798225 RepID=UPI000879CCC0|nr:hypothetical protein [Formosa sp. Hel1_31_208]SDS72750.1 hypothetical protein SAMN04515667_2841 [Formosa sp. Hel1_31_208]
MKESADKLLDNLSRKVIGESTIESPSLDFTQTLMSRINMLHTYKVTAYEPLISMRSWILIAFGMIAILGYSVFGTSKSENGLLSDLGLERFSNYEFTNPLASMEFSQTVIYSVVLFAIMLCIQIPLLKRYFNQRLDV